MAGVEWAIVPLILLVLFVFSLFGVPGPKPDPIAKASASAGAWAGLIVLVLFVISQKDRGLAFSFELPSYGFAFWPTFLATVGGFGFSRFLDLVRRTRVVGVFVLVLVASTSIALFSYVFIRDVRQQLVFVALGWALGVLLHEMFFPNVGVAGAAGKGN